MFIRFRSPGRLRARPLRLASAGLALVFLTTLGADAPVSVSQQIDEIVNGSSATAATWGIYVKDIRTGQILYSRNAEKALMPASNQKILTTATAIDALGGDFRYKTKLYFSGTVQGSVLQGDLVIQGSGDPTFGSFEMGGADPLRGWAQALKSIGITQIQGRIIGDDDVFDDKPFGEGWDIAYLTEQAGRSIGVSAGGLSYRDNVMEMRFSTEAVGKPPAVETIPANFVKVINEATTADRSRGWAMDISRSYTDDVVTLTGSLPRSYETAMEIPVTNPTTFTLAAFREHLQTAGIRVAANLLDVDQVEEQPDYSKMNLLFVHFSPPLVQIISLLNKESNNFYAEQVFRTMAPGGSDAGGAQRVKSLLGRAGISDPQIAIFDGCGLSRKDLVTPRAMVELLDYMAHHKNGQVFMSTLAKGGEPRSTLAGRLGGVPVQAKTGSIDFVRALSGYTATPDGHPVAFAIFVNNFTGPSYEITQTIDEVVRTVATGGVPQPEKAAKPRGRRR